MARFAGKVGYGETVEKVPGSGVAELIVHERSYFGDVIRNARQLQATENLHDNLAITNSISIVADAYANEHFFAIQYVEWAGTRWKVEDVTVERPRLILRLGGIYNGPTPD